MSAPIPTNPRIKIVLLPVEDLAVLRFSGSPNDVRERQKGLVKALSATTWRIAGETRFLSYDPTFAIPYLRRNEAAVPVSKTLR
jgi:hypothetical protein